MKIGIFGSSFNPLHIGHLITAEQARIRLNLDKVLFVPTANPYHKKVDLLDYELRYEMTERSIKDNKYFEMSDIEKNLDGNSYSYDVVKTLIEDEKGDYYFIMGSDSFNQLETWHRYEDFVKLVNLIVFKRPGYEIETNLFNKMKNITERSLDYIDDIQLEISSTYIRNMISKGYIPKYLLHEETYKFIEENETW